MTTFLLIPGAGGAGWDWHLVAAALSARGHVGVPVDLPAGDDDAGWLDYRDAVVAAGAGRGPVVLAALSMGGFSAPLVVGALDVTAIVLVNAMIPVPGETGEQWWTATGQRAAMEAAARAVGRDPAFDVVEGFFHDVAPEVRAEAFRRPEPVQSGTPFAEPWPGSAWPDVPTRGVAGRDDRLFPPEFQRRVARERLAIDLAVLPGGHLVTLSNPDGVVDELLSDSRS